MDLYKYLTACQNYFINESYYLGIKIMHSQNLQPSYSPVPNGERKWTLEGADQLHSLDKHPERERLAVGQRVKVQLDIPEIHWAIHQNTPLSPQDRMRYPKFDIQSADLQLVDPSTLLTGKRSAHAQVVQQSLCEAGFRTPKLEAALCAVVKFRLPSHSIVFLGFTDIHLQRHPGLDSDDAVFWPALVGESTVILREMSGYGQGIGMFNQNNLFLVEPPQRSR